MARKRPLIREIQLTLREVEQALAFTQPALLITETADLIVANGVYVVSDGPNAAGPLARFEIETLFPKTYPDIEPAIFETAGQIKRTAEWHMYPNGRCCTCVWEEWLAGSASTSIAAFCNGPLKNFFLSQVIFAETGEWPFGERSHGTKGVVEAVCQVLDLSLDEAAARRYIRAVAAKDVKGHWGCPCGSGRRLRGCHREQMTALRQKVNRSIANGLLQRLAIVSRLEKQHAN